MSQDLPVHRYTSELAGELADLISIRLDLQSAEDTCERLVAALKAEPNDGPLVDALWSAALVRYSRSFVTGRRRRLETEMLAHLPGDPIGAHSYYRNQRDKLIAHSVNSFEETAIGVVLNSEPRVVGIGDLHVRLISSDERGVRQLAALARELRRKVEPEIERMRVQVLEEAKASDVKQLAQTDILQYKAPEPIQSAKARR